MSRGLKSSIIVVLWVALLFVGLFLFSNEVLGATIFEDDFESYTTGQDLGAQEDWTCGFSNAIITEDKAHSWLKSVRNKYHDNPAESVCFKDGLPVEEEGSQQIWFYLTSGFTEFVSFEIDNNEVGIGIEDDLVKYLDPTYQWQTLTTFSEYDEWVSLAIEWRYSIHPSSEIRYSYNGGDWTDWAYYGATTNYQRVIISWPTQQEDAIFYFDTIEEVPPPCEIGSCWACGIYDDCIEAGCFFYYSIYGAGGLWGGQYGGSCVEPYDPDPEECGSFYKCQYCNSQETCEAEWCVWEDRHGLGEKCYMSEPVIPPEQVEWEVPDLEECGELSGVEEWLCEIKNFIAGIFMPSQEKVNSLYHTIGAFKDKFPFNYAGSLNRFFNDIEESIDEEKGIPIKILGQEGNVDFTFWDKTTTIGGVEETFKNIWFDFTTLVVILGFFIWIISWIRRFF